MALRRKQCFDVLGETIGCRLYSSKLDLKKLRPMILKRIQDRAKDYPIRELVPLAEQVLHSRSVLIQGVSTLLKVFPVQACK